MKVSIVIVNYNGEDIIGKPISSVYKSNFSDFEIIVLDNASTDGSVDFLRKKYPKVTIVENNSNLGYSGINSAIKYCKGKYILFLNNDLELEKNSIRNLVKVLESNSSIGMVAPKLVNYYNKKLSSGGTWISRAFYNGHIKNGKSSKQKVIPYLGVGLIRKNIVKKFGYLFDAHYFIYAEDVDLGLRLRLIGYKVVFVPDSIIYHMHAMTTKNFKSSQMTFLLERNLLMTFLKILSLKNIILMTPYILSTRIITILRDIITFRFSNSFSRIKAIFWIIFHVPLIWKKRKTLQILRKSDDKFILNVFSEKHLFKERVIV